MLYNFVCPSVVSPIYHPPAWLLFLLLYLNVVNLGFILFLFFYGNVKENRIESQFRRVSKIEWERKLNWFWGKYKQHCKSRWLCRGKRERVQINSKRKKRKKQVFAKKPARYFCTPAKYWQTIKIIVTTYIKSTSAALSSTAIQISLSKLHCKFESLQEMDLITVL